MSQANILVTGGAGYIGSHACKLLSKAGFLPVTYDDLSTGHADAVLWGPLVKGDVADFTRVAKALDDYEITGVLHFAASAYVGESVRNPGKYFENNTSKTISFLNCLLRNGVRDFVLSSTCATYGIPIQLPLTEDHPQHPINPYGESKLAIERTLRWYEAAQGLRWIVLRYFNAAGGDLDGEIGELHKEETHLVPLTIRATLKGANPLVVFGDDHPTFDGTAVRDYVHVSDLAAAHILALLNLREGCGSRAFNLGSGVGHSVAEVIEVVERIGGQPVLRTTGVRRPGDPPALVADPTLARKVLGWGCRYSDLEVIVRTAQPWACRQERAEREECGLTMASQAHAGI